jgi:hypothetical protein
MLEIAERLYYTPKINAEYYTEGDEGPDIVHIVGFNMMETLCGNVDRMDLNMHETDKRPTCTGCLEVWNYVKKHKL